MFRDKVKTLVEIAADVEKNTALLMIVSYFQIGNYLATPELL